MLAREDRAGTHRLMGVAFDDFGRAEYAAGEHIPSHTHPHFEICLLEEGEAVYSVSGKAYALCPGDVCITRPGELHGMATSHS